MNKEIKKKIFTRKEVMDIVKPSPFFNNFDDAIFEYREIPFQIFIEIVRTCRTPKDTFLEAGKKILDNKSTEDERYISDVMKLVNSYPYTEKLIISAFIHKALLIRWPDHYPSDSNIPEDAIIVEDGNHRLTALTIRYLKKMEPLYKLIDVYIGRLPNITYKNIL